MTEFEASSKPDISTASPELGLSLEVLPAKEVVETLDSFAFLNEELEEFMLEAGALSQLFIQGLPDTMWNTLIDMKRVGVKAFEGGANYHQIVELYAQLLEEAKRSSKLHIATYLEDANSFLHRHPGVMKQAPEEDAYLQRLTVEWDDYQAQHLSETIPATLIAEWSDASSTELTRGEDIFIDISRAPSAVGDMLHKDYQLQYEDIDRDGVYVDTTDV